MKKLLLFLFPPLLACIVFFSAMLLLSKSSQGKGALQVTATPKADVYLDGKLIGKAPFCKCDLPDMIPTGEYTVRLVPQDTNLQPFEQKIPINKSVITVVDVTFGDKNTLQGSIISLDPLPDTKATQIFATSFPDHAKISIDKNSSGETPILLKDVTASDHDLLFDKDGYQKKVLHISTKKGFKLTAIAFLAIKSNITEPLVSPSISPLVSGSPTPSPTGKVSSTPTPTLKISVTPGVSVSPASSTGSKVLILQTPTGFLRVRATPGGSEIGQVTPGQTFSLIDTQTGWYKITLSDGTTGWVSSQYAEKQ